MAEINNLTRFKINQDYFEKITRVVLKGERKTKIELSIALVSSAEIQKLNKKYRKKNKPTDVLSFIYFERSEKQGSRQRRGSYSNDSGEIVICPQVVRENAKKLRQDFKKEIVKVLIHGVLHILGYDHEKNEIEAEKMKKKEEFYLNKITLLNTKL